MGPLLALVYDRCTARTEDAGVRERRRGLLAEARGDVVEVGAGTGLNLPLYPRAGLVRIVAVEPDAHMARRLRRRRAGDAPAPVEVVRADGAALPFGDASFDTAVTTMVLCTVPDPAAVLAEVARVLRPGGRLLFLEHVRAHEARLARLQDRVTPVWRRVAGGCRPNRSTLATLRASPLRVERVDEGELPRSMPWTRPLIEGVAVRPPG
ncbi:MAG TPA: class I SAM-dependent methyltransferase [Solirubrobacteraceae bacterium]|nr:class I SAM-dependent methyltransferase [Solirubrobacteraceae bacterium]